MATFSTNISPKDFVLSLTVTDGSVNNQNNTSVVSYSLKLTAPSNWSAYGYGGYSIVINGTTVKSDSNYLYNFGYGSSITVASGTTSAITHNADGSKSINCSATFDGRNPTYIQSGTAKGTLTLTTIPRASTITSPNSVSIASTSGNVGVTVTSKANYYHKIDYQIGSGSWTNLKDKLQVNNTTSAAQNLSYSTILSGMPTVTSTTINFRVLTYSDSSESTQIGSTQTTSTSVSIDISKIKPTLTLGAITAVQQSGVSITDTLIAGYSQARTAYSVTNSAGANKVTTTFSISTGSMSTTSVTSISGNATSNLLPSNTTNITNLKITATATDSRGASVTVSTANATIYGYSAPKITASFYRVVDSTSTTNDAAGLYVYGTYSSAVGSNVNSKNSIQSTTCTMSGGLSGSFTSGDHKSLGVDKQVTFTVKATDKVTSTTKTYIVPVAKFSLDLYDNGSGTVGAAIGGVASSGYFDSYLKQRIKGVGAGNWITAVRNPALLIDNKTGSSSALVGMTIPTKDGKVGIAGLETNNILYFTYFKDSTTANSPDGRFQFNFDNMTVSGSPTLTYSGTASEATITRRLSRTLGSSNARMETANNLYTDSSVRFYQATSNMATMKPYNDGYILHFAWDNNGGYNAQLYISNSSNYPKIQVRMQSGTTWDTSWQDVSVEKTLWTGTLSQGNSVSINAVNCRRVKVFCYLAYTQVHFEIDLTTDSDSIPYVGSGFGMAYVSNAVERRFARAYVSTDKKTFTFDKCGYLKGTTESITPSATANYVYKIVGIY